MRVVPQNNAKLTVIRVYIECLNRLTEDSNSYESTEIRVTRVPF